MLAVRLFTSIIFVVLFGFNTLAVAETPDFSNIKRYAELANAAYEGRDKAQAESDRQGYQFTFYGTAASVEVAYFLLTNDARKSQIIAVRGTANVENVIVDADFKLVLDKHTSNMLHRGFAESAAAIYADVKPMLKRGYTINTTGHSLGGAVALVLAMYLDQDEYKLGQIITFGQPKVTNITGARRYAFLNITRVVTEKDIVPLVPPFDPTDLKNIDIFWHPGQELVLLSGDAYSLGRGIPSMMRAIQFFNEVPNEQNLQHHMMTLYLDLLDKKISNGNKVPYKTGIKLYDLF